MPLMRWKDEYLTFVEEIDEQHKRLFGLVNAIYDMIRMGRGQDAIAAAITELHEFSVMHFATEESYMEKTGFPLTAAHSAEHARLLDEVKQLRHGVCDGRVVVTMNEMYFLKDWLLIHFQGADKGLAGHLLRLAEKAIEDAAI